MEGAAPSVSGSRSRWIVPLTMGIFQAKPPAMAWEIGEIWVD
jgi:hypothetical protein